MAQCRAGGTDQPSVGCPDGFAGYRGCGLAFFAGLKTCCGGMPAGDGGCRACGGSFRFLPGPVVASGPFAWGAASCAATGSGARGTGGSLVRMGMGFPSRMAVISGSVMTCGVHNVKITRLPKRGRCNRKSCSTAGRVEECKRSRWLGISLAPYCFILSKLARTCSCCSTPALLWTNAAQP